MGVHSINTGKAVDSEHAKGLLESLLEEAKGGGIVAMAVSVVYLDGATEHGVSFDGNFNPDALIGCLERAKIAIATILPSDIGVAG